MEVTGQLHDPAALPPGKESLTPIGASLDTVKLRKISRPFQESNPSCPACCYTNWTTWLIFQNLLHKNTNSLLWSFLSTLINRNNEICTNRSLLYLISKVGGFVGYMKNYVIALSKLSFTVDQYGSKASLRDNYLCKSPKKPVKL
jgi:hypothetical protein